jgi:hypothetical protein
MMMTLLQISALWSEMPDSKDWSAPLGRAHQCVQRPTVYMVGADEAHGCEVFAVIDVELKRVLHEEEFPDRLIHTASWVEVEGSAKGAMLTLIAGGKKS